MTWQGFVPYLQCWHFPQLWYNMWCYIGNKWVRGPSDVLWIFSKCSTRFTYIFFRVHPSTHISIYHPTFLEDLCPLGWPGLWLSCLIKVNLYTMFAADAFTAPIHPFGLWHNYVSVLFVVLWWVLPGIIGTVCGPVGLTTLILALFRAKFGYFTVLQCLPKVIFFLLSNCGVEQTVSALCVKVLMRLNFAADYDDCPTASIDLCE